MKFNIALNDSTGSAQRIKGKTTWKNRGVNKYAFLKLFIFMCEFRLFGIYGGFRYSGGIKPIKNNNGSFVNDVLMRFRFDFAHAQLVHFFWRAVESIVEK